MADPYSNLALAAAPQYSPAMPTWGAPAQISQLNDMGTQTYGTDVNYANIALQQAFDPNSAIYNSNLNKTESQVGAQEAASGIAGTPYGAETTGSVLGNFNTAWNAQQVQNQSTGAATATGLQNAGANMINEAGQLNMQNIQANLQAYGLYGQELAAAMQAITSMDVAGISKPSQPADTVDQYMAKRFEMANNMSVPASGS